MDPCRGTPLSRVGKPIQYSDDNGNDNSGGIDSAILKVLTGGFNVIMYANKCWKASSNQNELRRENDAATFADHAMKYGFSLAQKLISFLPYGKMIIHIIKTIYWCYKYFSSKGNVEQNSIKLGYAMGNLILAAKTMFSQFLKKKRKSSLKKKRNFSNNKK